MNQMINASGQTWDVLIVGGGASGYFTAICLKERSPSLKIAIIEAGRKPLRKVLISGGGRCNVTQHKFEPKILVQSYPRGKKELLGPFHRFGPKEMVAWLKDKGIELNTEKDGRMFPASNRSQTIIDCFTGLCDRYQIKQLFGSKVTQITKKDNEFLLTLRDTDALTAKKVVLATGSDPSGYDITKSLGHEIVDPLPSLFTFKISHPLIEGMPGQSFDHVALSLRFDGEKSVFQQTGPMLVTHWGLSGPAILKLSAFAAPELFRHSYNALLRVNFLPEYKVESLYEDFLMRKRNDHQATVHGYKPSSMSKRFWQRLSEFVDFDFNLTFSEWPKEKLRDLARILCAFELKVSGKGIFKEEFVTCGGVKRNQIDYRSMESKKCPGLFFVGELTDVDGITGGYNFQNAWTGGWLAASKISQCFANQDIS